MVGRCALAVVYGIFIADGARQTLASTREVGEGRGLRRRARQAQGCDRHAALVCRGCGGGDGAGVGRAIAAVVAAAAIVVVVVVPVAHGGAVLSREKGSWG